MNEVLITDKIENVFDPDVMTFDERQRQLEEEEKKAEERRKREKQSPYSRWTQFNLELTKELMWLGLNHPKARAILDFLVDQMDNHNAVMCSYQVIQELLGISEKTVARAIKILKEHKFIDILKSGKSNVYVINDTVYWKSWQNNRQYSKFSANIIVALSEQEENHQPKFEKIETSKIKTVALKSNNEDKKEQGDWKINGEGNDTESSSKQSADVSGE